MPTAAFLAQQGTAKQWFGGRNAKFLLPVSQGHTGY
jgi:hypothetical protein